MDPTLPNSDWTQRTRPISFKRLMAIKLIGDDTFKSLSSGFPPGVTSRTYGGHVYAQSAWAASHTVTNGYHIHNMTGHFLEAGDSRFSFLYHVKRVRDGGVYALRTVEAYQYSEHANKDKNLCFTATIGFKRDEGAKHKQGLRKSFEHQAVEAEYLRSTYKIASRGKPFEEHLVEPANDGVWSDQLSLRLWKQRGAAFPGLEQRKVNMRNYNGRAVEGATDGGLAARRWRYLRLYRFLREIDVQDRLTDTDEAEAHDTDDTDTNLHACAHLYGSDRNSIYIGQRALGYEGIQAQAGSLAHTVVFHGPSSRLKMVDEATGNRRVYVQETWVSDSGADRICLQSRLFDYKTGHVIATTLQDAMMRFSTSASATAYDGADLQTDSKL